MLLKKSLFSAFMAAGILLSVSALEVQADPLETGTKAMQETQESAQAANAGDLTESSMKITPLHPSAKAPMSTSGRMPEQNIRL